MLVVLTMYNTGMPHETNSSAIINIVFFWGGGTLYFSCCAKIPYGVVVLQNLKIFLYVLGNFVSEETEVFFIATWDDSVV